MDLRPEVIGELLDAGMARNDQGSNQSIQMEPSASHPGAAGQRATPSMLLQNLSDSGPVSDLGQVSSPAATWLANLTHDRFYRKERKKSRKRSYSTGNNTILKTAENSPNTFVLQHNYEPSPLSRTSPRHNSTGSLSPLSLAVESEPLPPLMLPSSGDSPQNKASPSFYSRPGAPILSSSQQAFIPEEEHDWHASHWLEKRIPTVFPNDRFSSLSENTSEMRSNEHGWVQLNSGRRAWAEYQVLNQSLHLHPQLVVHVESPDTFSNNTSPDSMRSSDIPRSHLGSGSSRASPSSSNISSPSDSLRQNLQRMSISDFDLGSSAKETPTPSNQKAKCGLQAPPGFHYRRIVIPLVADERFFESLSAALRKLLQLHLMQQQALVRHVNALRDTIALVASPQNSPKDLYRWREIFGLWVEHDIFESSREKDRGELSVAASQHRLHKYLCELEKRGFLSPHRSLVLNGKMFPKLETWEVEGYTQTNPLQDPRSIQALEYFLRLNVALVTLKRFQRLNIEIVRKILKKHEKKTALHAHQALGRLMIKMQPNELLKAATNETLLPDVNWETASHADILRSLSALVPMGLSTSSQLSLPRILASMLTKALLPVLPSVDDYSCLICTGLAYQPVRLKCKHLFCIRCLVKLQKQGDNHCPLCRSENAVRDADEHSLDHEMAEYLRTYFPQEVEDKVKENKSDRELEHQKELAMKRKKRFGKFRRRVYGDDSNHDCIIM